MNNSGDQTDTGFSFLHENAEEATKTNFNQQGFLNHIGAYLGNISPGTCEIFLPFSDKVDQQHGYFHGGATATIADGASGAAAISLAQEGATVLTTEFKINYLAPAHGERLIARGRVIKSGRTLTVCQSDVYAEKDGKETLIATALLTMICVPASRNKEKNHDTE